MKALMKYACPLMMLGFPTLIFAADTLRQLNAKAKSEAVSPVLQQGIMAETGCHSGTDTISAVGDVYSLSGQFYRCVTIFDHRHQIIGAAWVALDQLQSRGEIALRN